MSAFNSYIRRRDFTAMLAGTVVAGTVVAGQASGTSVATDDDSFELRYMLGSCMYGYTPLAEILPETNELLNHCLSFMIPLIFFHPVISPLSYLRLSL